MYFDLEDYHPDISPVGQAISWREGVLLSIIAHLVVVILTAPWFLFVGTGTGKFVILIRLARVAPGRDGRRPGTDERRAQTRFQREWLALKRYANDRGIRLIGDIPLYVSGASCDVATHPELFDRSVVAGAAPSLTWVGHATWLVRLAGPQRALSTPPPGCGLKPHCRSMSI